MLAMLVLIQAAIAVMISRVGEAYAPYTLGMSLARLDAASTAG